LLGLMWKRTPHMWRLQDNVHGPSVRQLVFFAHHHCSFSIFKFPPLLLPTYSVPLTNITKI